MDEKEIRALVEELAAAFNGRDLDRFDACLDELVVWNDPAMLYGPAIGRSAARKFNESILKAFPDFTYRIRHPICIAASGERCAVPFELAFTHTGCFDPPGFAPTYQSIRTQGVDVLQLANGKIVALDTMFDIVSVIEQALRLKPFPKSGFKKAILLGAQKCRAYWLRRTTKTTRQAAALFNSFETQEKRP